MDAEVWLATERSLIDRDTWTPPPQRKIAEGPEGHRLVGRDPPLDLAESSSPSHLPSPSVRRSRVGEAAP
jgi:hypothetical protein